jgi:CubicO group peptidase (beta-lactamase class C family)
VAATAAASTSDAIIAALQHVATDQSAKYNMSIALAFHQPSTSADPLAVAAGFTDSGLGLGTPTRRADPYDKYVWGSTTKMFTAPAVLQLVERGVVGLDDPCAKHIDPILQQLNGTTLASSLGADVASVTIRQLLHMESGVRDYDNANYTAAQFADRAHEFGPVETLGFVEPGLRFPAGSRQSYCSANYVLLGLVLARHYHQQGAAAWSWQAYDQRTVIPDARQSLFPNSTFADAKPCSAWTPVHGFMGHYEGSDLPAQDVWDVSCVGGWTGGNYVGSVSDVARFTYDLYSLGGPVVSAASQALLTNFTAAGGGGFKFYGMGTFSLDWYGHTLLPHPTHPPLCCPRRRCRRRSYSPPAAVLRPLQVHRRRRGLRARGRHVRLPKPDHVLPRARLRAHRRHERRDHVAGAAGGRNVRGVPRRAGSDAGHAAADVHVQRAPPLHRHLQLYFGFCVSTHSVSESLRAESSLEP